MPRKRSNLHQHVKHLPEEYHKHILIRDVVVITAAIMIACALAVIACIRLKEAQLQRYPIKVQVPEGYMKQVELKTYYTDKIEVYDGEIHFTDSQGIKVVTPTAFICTDRIGETGELE